MSNRDEKRLTDNAGSNSDGNCNTEIASENAERDVKAEMRDSGKLESCSGADREKNCAQRQAADASSNTKSRHPRVGFGRFFGRLSARVATVICSVAVFTVVCAAVVLFSSHVFGDTEIGVGNVDFAADAEFSMVTKGETLSFTKGGERKSYDLSVTNSNESPLEYYYTLSYVAGDSVDIASAILVYFDGELLGTLSELCSKGDGATGETEIGIGYVKAGGTHTGHNITFELHEAAPDSYFDGNSVSVTVTAYTKTVDYSKYMLAGDENGFLRAVDDVNTGLVDEYRIVLTDNVTLSKGYTLNYPVTVDLNGYDLDFGGNTLTLKGEGTVVIDSSSPVADGDISGSVELASEGALLDIREFKTLSGANGGAKYSSRVTLTSYDTDSAKEMLIERVEDLHASGVFAGEDVYLFGALWFYANAVTPEFGSYSDGVLSLPVASLTEVNNISSSIGSLGVRVIGDDDAIFEEIVREDLAHIPTDGETRITSDIFLPKSLKSKNATLIWTTGDDRTLSSEGNIADVVNDNKQVKLFAEIRVNNRVYTKEFSFRVSSQNNEMKFSYLVAQLSPITLTMVYDPEKNNGRSAFHHLPIVDPAYPRSEGEAAGYDYREQFTTPEYGGTYSWLGYKDIGLERIEYRVTNTYNYISVESATNAAGQPISYAYLNIPVFNTYAQIEITGYYSNTEYYTDTVNVIIQLGDDADLQNKVFRYVENILNKTDILQNILDTRAAEGMAKERGDFDLPNEYITYDIIYAAADSSKDAITNVTTLYRGEGDTRTVSGYRLAVDPANFYTTETPLGITVTIKHKTAEGASPAMRILYVDAPPVIKPDDGGFANLSVFNSIKYQVYTQLPEDERDGDSGFVVSNGQITNNTGAYILMRDAQHENVKNLTLTTMPSADTVNAKVYILSRLLEWATSSSEYSAREVWSGASAVNSDGKDYLTDAELGVVKSYWRSVTGSEMSSALQNAVFETAVGRVIVDGKAIGDALANCGFSNSYYFKYTETLYWMQDKQNFGVPAGGKWDGSPPNLGSYLIEYTFNAKGEVSGYTSVSRNNWQNAKYYTNSYYQEDSSPYISEAEAEVFKALILNLCGTRTTSSSDKGVAFVNVFNASTIIPNYLRDGGVGYLVRELYKALSAYPTRLAGEYVTLNKFTSTLYDGIPVITSPDNALVGIQYFINLEKLSVIGDTENEYGLSAFLDSSALLNFFNQMTTFNEKIKDLEMIACARNYVEFDIGFTERLVALERLNYAANYGIKNVGPLVNLNMGQLAYLNIAGVDVSFEFSEYVMENIYYKYYTTNGTYPQLLYFRDGSSVLTRYTGTGTPAESLTYLNEIGKIRSEYLQLCHTIVGDGGTDDIIWRIESGNMMSYVTVAGDMIGFDSVENYYYCKESVGGLERGHIYSFNSNGDGYFVDLGEFTPVATVPDEIEFTDEEKQNAQGSGENTVTDESISSITVDNSSTGSTIGNVTNQTSQTNSMWGGTYGTLQITYVDQNGNEKTATVSNVSRIGCDRSIKKTVVSEVKVTIENLRSISKQATYYVEADGTVVRCVYTFKSGTAREQTYEVTKTYWSNDYYYITGNNNNTKTYLSNTAYSGWTQLSYDYYVRSGWNSTTNNVKVSPSEKLDSEVSGYDENNFVSTSFDDAVTKDSQELLISPIGIIETEEKVSALRTLMAAAIARTAIYKYTGNMVTVDYYNNSTTRYKNFTFNANYYYDGTVDANGFVTWTRNTAIANNTSIGSGGMDAILAAANASIGTSEFLSYYGMYYGYAGSTVTTYLGNTYENLGIYRLLINSDGKFYFEHDAEKMGLKVNRFEILTSVIEGLLGKANGATDAMTGEIYYYSGANADYYQGRTFYILSAGDTGEYVCKTFGAVNDHEATNGTYILSNERVYDGNYYGGTGGTHQIVISAIVTINGEEHIRRFLVDVVG